MGTVSLVIGGILVVAVMVVGWLGCWCEVPSLLQLMSVLVELTGNFMEGRIGVDASEVVLMATAGPEVSPFGGWLRWEPGLAVGWWWLYSSSWLAARVWRWNCSSKLYSSVVAVLVA